MENITLTIDNHKISVPPGTTILQAAQKVGAEIPVICYHPNFTANSLCRLCVVEQAGGGPLIPSCSRRAEEGMVIRTRGERVDRSRRVTLELLNSTVDLSEAPEILAYFDEYDVDEQRFAGGKRREFPVYDDNPFYIRDYSKCIMCWRCVQACGLDAQYTFAIDVGARGFESHIVTFLDKPIPDTTCVFCGNCVGACPTGALKSKREWWLEQGHALEDMPRWPEEG